MDKQIITMYKQQEYIYKIIEKVNTNIYYIKDILVKNKLYRGASFYFVTEKEMKYLYVEKGYSLNEIKNKFKLNSKDSIKTLLKRYDISLREQKIFPLTKEELQYKYIDKNLSSKQIAQEIGFGRGTVQRYLRVYNIRKNEELSNECSKREAIKGSQEKFGTNHPFQNKEHLNKANEQARKLFSVSENVFQSETIKQKSKETNMRKYNVTHYSKTNEFIENIKYINFLYSSGTYTKLGQKVLLNEENFSTFMVNNSKKYNVADLKQLFGGRGKRIYMLLSLTNTYDHINNYFSHYESKFLKEFRDYFGENIEIISNDRKILNNLELDFYLPQYKIGIEINPNYTHHNRYSEYCHYNSGKDKDYHRNKSILSESKGIQLIHIWEHDYIDLRSKFCHIESIIEDKLEITPYNENYINGDLYTKKQVERVFEIVDYKQGIFFSDSRTFEKVNSTIIMDESCLTTEDKLKYSSKYPYTIYNSGLYEIKR